MNLILFKRGNDVLHGMIISEWVDAFLERKLRFLETSLFEKIFNENFERQRLKILQTKIKISGEHQYKGYFRL